MDLETAKKQVKYYLEDYLLEEHGIDVARNRKNFHCLNPEHPDRNPSMNYDKQRNKVHCFSCDADYDLIDLIAADRHLTTADAFKYAYDKYNIQPSYDSPRSPQKSFKPKVDLNSPEYKEARNKAIDSQIKAYIDECSRNIEQTNYFATRGISLETAKRFNLGYDPNFTNSTGGNVWQAVIIPTSDYSYSARNTNPEADHGHRYRKTKDINLFNLKAAYQADKPVFIVEGEIDALSILEVDGQAIGLGSVSNIARLLEELQEESNPDTLFLISLDNDKTGDEHVEQLEQGLNSLGLNSYRSPLPKGYHDANDLLVDNKTLLEYFVKEQPQTAKEAAEIKERKVLEDYKSQSATWGVNSLLKDLETNTTTNAYSTGFKELDNILDGGLYAGLYVIGAISSLGKTTFTLQIADQIAKSGKDVLVYSLEMAERELLAKSLSRTSYVIDDSKRKSYAKTTRDLLTNSRYQSFPNGGADKALIAKSIVEYSQITDHLYIIEGNGDIGTQDIYDRVKQHVEITGNIPVVIIDYLQILEPYVNKAEGLDYSRSSDKQITDKNVKQLKILSRDFSAPIFAISSFNRENYNNPVSLTSFKESGAIEYSSDVLIGLQYAGMDPQEETAKERAIRLSELRKTTQANARNGLALGIELKILKSRNGTKGRAGFKFYPKFNYFEEVEPNFDLQALNEHVQYDMLDKEIIHYLRDRKEKLKQAEQETVQEDELVQAEFDNLK